MNTHSSKSPELEITGDGSHTLYSEKFNQAYHNIHGAVTESKHVFFEQTGLIKALREKEEIHILEIGFGTGLNLLLLMDYALRLKPKAKIIYHSIEAFPISPETAAQLNYGEHLHHSEMTGTLTHIFSSLKTGYNTFQITKNIKLTLFNDLFEDYSPDDLTFDFMFQDAFSPEANPELWTGKIFERLLQWSKPEALLTTYCASSKARGAMAWAGWKVARAKGILGKREMTLASPSDKPLAHLKRINEQRLAQRYEEDDFE